MKDMPAMGQKDYDISTSVTGDSGATFLEILTSRQSRYVTDIVDKQRKALMEIIDVREEISRKLRGFLEGDKPDSEEILALGRRYGELDGEMSWYYASAFGEVNRTVTEEQRSALVKLRNLPGYESAEAYIYSAPAEEGIDIPDTDHFFFPSR